MPTTLTAEVERVTYENEETSFRVIKVRELGAEAQGRLLAAVGTFQAVGPGTRVRITGEIVNDPRHGQQLKVESLVPLAPNTLEGLEKYLGSGAFPGMGPGFAKRIVGHFGIETLKVLDNQPERLQEVPGLGEGRISQIRAGWAAQHGISNVMMLLSTHGASPALAARICRHYGDKAAAIVQRFPYRLALDVRGIGFKTADRIARSLGIAGDHPERAQAGVIHVLGELAEQGHVFAVRELLEEQTAQMLGIDTPHVNSAIDALWAGERLVVEDRAVYLTRLHRAERELGQRLVAILQAPAPELAFSAHTLSELEERLGLELGEQQKLAIRTAATAKVVVITGGPGVGKTTIVRAILSLFERRGKRVRLAAPTGRAAKRMSEATGHDATTIHRLLEFEPRSADFGRNEQTPLDLDALILDESSMIDVPLAAALFTAVPDPTRVVIVGDADQLPSVGPGAFLRDVIGSNRVPTVRLDQVFRQAAQSRIVQNAHRILHGEQPESVAADDPQADFFIIQRREPDKAAQVVRELVTERIPRRFGLDPKRDVQVLAPMHRGPCGIATLNQELQQALNPDGPALEWRGQRFRAGDKVMQTKNDYERETFNGDVGFVAQVNPAERALSVQFDERTVDYADSDLDALVLAYATTIHKSQGSEYPAVVIPILTTHFVMLSKNLVYTAVTRAKRLCVLVADPRALRLAIGETRREERMTRLRERIIAALDGRIVAADESGAG